MSVFFIMQEEQMWAQEPYPWAPRSLPAPAQAPADTYQAPGSRVDGGEREIGTLHLPHGTGVQPVVRRHGTICPHIGAWGGQHQGLQQAVGKEKKVLDLKVKATHFRLCVQEAGK